MKKVYVKADDEWDDGITTLHVTMDIDVNDQDLDEVKSMLNYNIDYLMDLDNWPEIIGVNNVYIDGEYKY